MDRHLRPPDGAARRPPDAGWMVSTTGGDAVFMVGNLPRFVLLNLSMADILPQFALCRKRCRALHPRRPLRRPAQDHAAVDNHDLPALPASLPNRPCRGTVYRRPDQRPGVARKKSAPRPDWGAGYEVLHRKGDCGAVLRPGRDIGSRPGMNSDFIAQGKSSLDRGDQGIVVAAGKIGAADRSWNRTSPTWTRPLGRWKNTICLAYGRGNAGPLSSTCRNGRGRRPEPPGRLEGPAGKLNILLCWAYLDPEAILGLGPRDRHAGFSLAAGQTPPAIGGRG